MKARLKNTVKILFGAIFYYSGAFHMVRLWNNLRGRRLTIVTYHRVTERAISELKHSLPFLFVSTNSFRLHLDFFKRHYRLMDFARLSSYLNNGEVPPNSLILTFDDGYRDNLLYALPLIKKEGCPWVLFLATGLVGSGGRCWWDGMYSALTRLREFESQDRLPPLPEDLLGLYREFKKGPAALFARLNGLPEGRMEKLLESAWRAIPGHEEKITGENKFLHWTDIEKMAGLMEFGSHTHLHVNLKGVDRRRAAQEIGISKRILEERIGKKVLAFSYPAGGHDDELVARVESAGYRFAVTTEPGINDLKNPHLLKRINIWEGTAPYSDSKYAKGWFAYKISGF